jgi:D-alanyl-lipoteichoic acid acyltransferase DltB (MBOAT superfamily)
LAILLTLAAALPLFGYDLIMRDLKIVSLNDYPLEIQHLVVTRSAAFATLAFFSVNFLRRKRPLSSVAPMLVFCNFTLCFGLFFVVTQDPEDWRAWLTLGIIAGLSALLFSKNEAETRRIFKDDW